MWGWGVCGWGVGVRLRAGEGEFCRRGAQCGWELGWEELEGGARLEAGPTLPGPMEPTEVPPPAPPTEPGGATGLLTGREGGVGIWACWGRGGHKMEVIRHEVNQSNHALFINTRTLTRHARVFL